MKNKKSKELARLTILIENTEQAMISALALQFLSTIANKMNNKGIKMLLKCIDDITKIQNKINDEYSQKYKGQELLEHMIDIKRYTLAVQVHLVSCFLVESGMFDNVFWLDEKKEKGYFVIGKVEVNGKTVCIGFDIDNFETNNYTGISNEITSDEQRTIKYMSEEDGITYLSPSFSDCEGWLKIMMKNFQNGNISF